MVDLSRFVSTSDGEIPSVRIRQLVTYLVGTVLFGWILGIVDVLSTLGGGIGVALRGFESWVTSLLRETLAVPSSALSTAAQSNADFLVSLGALGIVLAVVEVVVVMTLVLWGGRILVSGVVGI